ncbi:hypothetical protein ABL78_4607 [Leptomonas seymouri]|uniref:Uncharacterized protein n=1 Tax=Leptomonas seymouri TaxID=5684 RepID=A0A0N1PBG7_LEPSE|nr:hypothetical protein ABL78_4607 [Leptomonas seymouri]|eukprot:KPI86341.1 hypothetical protein ABL78_4607 [Leptomonas seymouri]
MPVKKASTAAATLSSSGSATPVRLRKRSLLSLNGNTNGNEAAAAPTAAATTAISASAPVKKATTRARTSVASTSIAAQQAALLAAANAPRARTGTSVNADSHVSAGSTTAPSSAVVVNGANSSQSSSSAAYHAAGASAALALGHKNALTEVSSIVSATSKARNPHVASTQTTATASSGQQVAAASPTQRDEAPAVASAGISSSGVVNASSSASPAIRRQRGNIGAAAAGSGSSGASTTTTTVADAASPSSNAPPKTVIGTKIASAATTSTPPPASHRSDSSSHPGAPLPSSVASAPPSTTVVQPSHRSGSGGVDSSGNTAAITGTQPRRTSAPSDADSAVQSTKVASASVAAGAAAAELTREVQRDRSTVVATRQTRKRTSTGAASSTRTKTSSSTNVTTAADAAISGAHAAAPRPSLERGRKRDVRHSSDSGTAPPARPSGMLASQWSSTRGSASIPATAANTAPPTRDSSAARQQQQQHGSVTSVTTAPASRNTVGSESFTSTMLDTARGGVSELESSVLSTAATTPRSTVAPLSNLPRRSHGPVVSEEWTRSIIKPGDEQLLYAPANTGFACTQLEAAMKRPRGSAGAIRNGSKGSLSLYDPQLRQAQQTVLQQRHIATPTPGRRSTNGAVIDRSGSRLGSTVRRSGTRLQKLRHEVEERQRSLNAAQPSPNNEEDSTMQAHGLTAGSGTGGPNSASPTPSRLSEASANRGVGVDGGGRFSVGTPASRRTTSSSEIPIEHIPGAASVVGGLLQHTTPGASGQHSQQQLQQPQQRNSPSLSLFARPSPRIFATPSPRGSTGTSGVPGMLLTFGVSNTAYSTGSEELTKLTRVREDMLRALLLSSTASTASETTAAKIKDEGSGGDGATTPLSNPSSSPHASHTDQRTKEGTTSDGTSPSAAKRPRQRIYGVDIRPSANGETIGSPQRTPAANVSKPQGGVGSNSARDILVSSIRQKPSRALADAGSGRAPLVSPSLSTTAASAGSDGGGSGSTGSTTRPRLSTAVLGATDPSFSATNTAKRLSQRSMVAVAVANLQPANALGERVRAQLARQSEQTQKAAATCPWNGGETATVATAVPVSSKLSRISFEEATRRLLLDPFFPLISEENYQRLVLQNDEYNDRKELVVRICAEPQPPVEEEGEDGKPRRSSTIGPRAARALEMDLAEADEAVTAFTAVPLDAAAAMAPSPHAAFSSTTSPGGNNNNDNVLSISSGSGGAAPRRPSVQYGGPTAHPSSSQPRARSPSPGAPPTSPSLVGSLNSPSAPSPSRDSKLLVNAVMPSEKTGPIKPLAVSGVWYTPSVAPTDAAQAAVFPAALNVSNLNNGHSTPICNSPQRAYSRSPSLSRSSSRQTTRRGSLFHGAQHNMLADALASQSGSSDSESTASDEVVNEAETVLRQMLQRWGPFHTFASTPSPPPTASKNKPSSSTRQRRNSSSTASMSASSVHNMGRKGKKSGGEKSCAAALEKVSPATTSAPTAASVLPPAMLDELDMYVHFFLKRFRNADAATTAEIGDVPMTPLALQRAIRQSLQLSCSCVTSGGATEDVEGALTELQDPLDDGSFHSQNVQYVLDLFGSLLQMQDSFCEDSGSSSGSVGRVTPRAARVAKRSKAKLTEADFFATVMCPPALDKSRQHGTDESVRRAEAGGNTPSTMRKSCARPVLKLHYPELRAVELMFASPADAVVAKGDTTAKEKS